MPLRDHFRPPLAEQRSWDGLRWRWPAMIVIDLNLRLPERYVAEPQVHRRPWTSTRCRFMTPGRVAAS